MQKKKNFNKVLLMISAGFVALMLTISVALYLSPSDTPVRVESQDVKTEINFQLEDLNLEEPIVPTSHVDLDDELLIDAELANVDVMNNETPEPATLITLTVGGIGLLLRRKRRRG